MRTTSRRYNFLNQRSLSRHNVEQVSPIKYARPLQVIKINSLAVWMGLSFLLGGIFGVLLSWIAWRLP